MDSVTTLIWLIVSILIYVLGYSSGKEVGYDKGFDDGYESAEDCYYEQGEFLNKANRDVFIRMKSLNTVTFGALHSYSITCCHRNIVYLTTFYYIFFSSTFGIGNFFWDRSF